MSDEQHLSYYPCPYVGCNWWAAVRSVMQGRALLVEHVRTVHAHAALASPQPDGETWADRAKARGIPEHEVRVPGRSPGDTPSPTRPDLDAIRARADAATPGPWSAQAVSDGVRIVTEAEGLRTWERDLADVNHQLPYGTAWFIAAARTDIPALLAYARRLEEAIVTFGDAEDAWFAVSDARPYDAEAAARASVAKQDAAKALRALTSPQPDRADAATSPEGSIEG